MTTTAAATKKLTVSLAITALFLSACGSTGPKAAETGSPQASSTAGAASPAGSPKPAPNAEPAAAVKVPDRVYWKPPEGWVGDVMPFANDGKIELFYLQDWRNDSPGFHPIFRTTTSNLIDFTYHAEAIPFSEIGKQDLAIGTGSVIKVGDTYHFFYTGHNWMFPKENKAKEAVMHAVSKDLQKWTKIPEDTFYAPEGYERNDFRDPFVIYNEKKQEYWMLVSARKGGAGVLAVFTSKDLKGWKVQEPLSIEDTSKYFMLECADIFQMGDTWYLVFSEFSDKGATHYRTSKSLEGPWSKPQQDLFDGKGFYAAKSATLGDRRFLFGWVPTRQNGKDFMKWDWAGNMVSHELVRKNDGTLSVKVPDEVAGLFSKEVKLAEERKLGQVSAESGKVKLDGSGGLAGTYFPAIPPTAKITGTVTFDSAVDYTGIVFGVGDEPEKAYGIRFQPEKGILRYDAAPNGNLGSIKPDMQVPAKVEPGKPYKFTIIVENDVAAFYLNDDVALTARIYKLPGGRWGWYSSRGKTVLEDLRMYVPASTGG